MILDDVYVEKYRPKTLKDIALQPQHRKYFEDVVKTQSIKHLLFAGSPGTGKTSLSKIIVNDILQCQYLYINASDENGIDTIRSKVIGFAQTKSFDGKFKVVLLDECDALSSSSQDALRNVMEEYYGNTRFIMTCNYQHKLTDALQSRCTIFNLTPPLPEVVKRAAFILQSEGIKICVEQKVKLIEYIKSYYPDVRRIINDIQLFSYSGELSIVIDESNVFATSLFNKILSNTDSMSIRKYTIENEQLFSNSYINLHKQLFETVFECDLNNNLKEALLKSIGEYMYKDGFVVDKEINFFMLCLKLKEYII